MLTVGVEFTDWDTARVVCSLGDITVEKTAKLQGLALKVCANDIESQRLALTCEILRKAREADRDIAFRLHGQDFRKHCAFQSNFWRMMTAEEMERISVN